MKLEELFQSPSLTARDFKIQHREVAEYLREWRNRGQQTLGYTVWYPGRYLSEAQDPQRQRQAQAFRRLFKSLDQRHSVELAVGSVVGILSVSLSQSKATLEIDGYTSVKRIKKINLDISGAVDSLEFNDGSQWPEAAELITVGGQHITDTAFFPSQSELTRAYTTLWLDQHGITALENQGWQIENRLQESQDVREAPEPGKTAVYAFGRFNPPNPGHQRLVNYLKRLAKKYDADWYLFISPRDSDPEKNPLSGAQKLAWWQAILPEDRDHFIMDPGIPMSDYAAAWLYGQGYKNAVVAYGAGEEQMRFPIAQNGRSTNAKGQPLRAQYAFDQFVDGGSPGEQDAQGIAGDPDLRSTDLRGMVRAGDREGFYRAVGVSPAVKIQGLDYFDTIARAMGIDNK